MLHRDKEEFLKILKRTSAQTGFPLRLLEKDYYITILLSNIHKWLSDELILKGGTCLNKVYYFYYRLSEDLDFTIKLPKANLTRTIRRKTIQPIKESVESFAKKIEMTIINPEKAGHDESKQYIYYFSYPSVVLKGDESVKFEIGLRFNPLLPVEKKDINHKFLHPFTKEPLFNTSKVLCLSLQELVAEKMRAACTRRIIAARDFYDLGYLIERQFDFKGKEFLSIFKKKLEEDGFSTDLKNYKYNLGRNEVEINDMKLRLKDELFPVLTVNARKNFDIQKVLDRFNKIFEDIQ